MGCLAIKYHSEQPQLSFVKGGLFEAKKYTKSYRFGFNGKEKDNEAKGVGNQQDYGFRIYDSRLGRFLSVDPITNEYPMLTPYQFASNTPIMAIDLDGLEGFIVNKDYVNGTVNFVTRPVFDPGMNFGIYISENTSTHEQMRRFDYRVAVLNFPNVQTINTTYQSAGAPISAQQFATNIMNAHQTNVAPATATINSQKGNIIQTRTPFNMNIPVGGRRADPSRGLPAIPGVVYNVQGIIYTEEQVEGYSIQNTVQITAQDITSPYVTQLSQSLQSSGYTVNINAAGAGFVGQSTDINDPRNPTGITVTLTSNITTNMKELVSKKHETQITDTTTGTTAVNPSPTP